MKAWLLALIAVVIGGALLAAGSGWYFLSQRSPVAATAQPTQRFVIPQGQAATIIATRLQEAGLIRNAFIFRLELKRLGLESKLQAGSFEVSPTMSAIQVAQTLTTGTNDIWITIPEGWRREEIAEYLAQQELSVFDEAEFLDKTATLEGKLFPETYLLPREITTTAVVNLLTRTFASKVESDLAQEISASGQSLEAIITMASLVEREARTYEQMRLVAGILWQRLEIDMPLQVDATLQYAKGYDRAQNSWWATPLGVDRQRDNLFNTYMYAGLPPGPIANPGLNAVKATLNPLSTNDLFYIHAPDGQMYTAETLVEHNQNIQRYLR